jgi:hypothetical protein
MKPINKLISYLALSCLTIIAITLGCSEKIVNQRGDQRLAIGFKLASEEMADEIKYIVLTISAADIIPPIVDTIVFNNQSAPIDTIVAPSGNSRTFTMEAYGDANSAEDIILYRGTLVADILPETEISLTIDMRPVVPCVKYSPRSTSAPDGSQLTLNIKAFNLTALNSIELLIPIMPGMYGLEIDSVARASDLPENALFYATPVDNGFYIGINVDHTGTTPIVDNQGNGVLAKVFLTVMLLDYINNDNPITLPLSPISINGDSVSINDTLLVEGCVINVTAPLPPKIEISYPPEGATFEGRWTNVAGSIEGLFTPPVILSLNGNESEIAVMDGAFYQDIVLFNGDNEIIVSARALSGYAIADTVHVQCEQTASGLRVELTWDKDSADVDLWVTEPDSTLVNWQFPFAGTGELDLDDTSGYGPENYSNDQPADGDYIIQAHLYNDGGQETVITTVRIFIFEDLIDEIQDTLSYEKELRTVCTVGMPEGSITQPADSISVRRPGGAKTK